MELEWVKGSECRAPYHREFDHNPIDMVYSSSHKDHKEQGVEGRGPFRDDLSDLKIKEPELDGNHKSKNYTD